MYSPTVIDNGKLIVSFSRMTRNLYYQNIYNYIIFISYNSYSYYQNYSRIFFLKQPLKFAETY